MMTGHSRSSKYKPVTASLREYGRGVTGGLIFSLPLLYTMEVWWTGFIISPERLIGYIIVVYVLLLGYNRYTGIRRDVNWIEIAMDSFEEMGLGLLVAALVLYLIGQISVETAPDTAIGRVVLEGMIAAIGVSIGNSQLSGGADDGDKGMQGDSHGGEGDQGESGSTQRGAGAAGQIVIAFCGALVFASNVAPTEEIILIAFDAGPWKLMGLSILSMALALGVLYYFDLVGARQHVGHRRLEVALAGTAVAYATGLLASAMMLYVFHRYDGVSLSMAVNQTVALGFLGTLGAAVGRLLLQ